MSCIYVTSVGTVTNLVFLQLYICTNTVVEPLSIHCQGMSHCLIPQLAHRLVHRLVQS